jgi:hypothetical protein
MMSVIATPMIGSPICSPSETTRALATTPSETKPSTQNSCSSYVCVEIRPCLHERREIAPAS